MGHILLAFRHGMSSKSGELSQDIYRRIYRLGQQKVDPRIIAAALKLPFKTVSNVLERLSSIGTDSAGIVAVEEKLVEENQDDLLSVFVFPKMRYAVMDLGGKLTGDNADILRRELQVQLDGLLKAVAVRLSDVTEIDSRTVDVLIWAKAAFTAKGRFVGLLDPAPAIEKQILKFELDEKIPIFGTESTFEEKAFATTISSEKKKTRLS